LDVGQLPSGLEERRVTEFWQEDYRVVKTREEKGVLTVFKIMRAKKKLGKDCFKVTQLPLHSASGSEEKRKRDSARKTVWPGTKKGRRKERSRETSGSGRPQWGNDGQG